MAAGTIVSVSAMVLIRRDDIPQKNTRVSWIPLQISMLCIYRKDASTGAREASIHEKMYGFPPIPC